MYTSKMFLYFSNMKSFYIFVDSYTVNMLHCTYLSCNTGYECGSKKHYLNPIYHKKPNPVSTCGQLREAKIWVLL